MKTKNALKEKEGRVDEQEEHIYVARTLNELKQLIIQTIDFT